MWIPHCNLIAIGCELRSTRPNSIDHSFASSDTPSAFLYISEQCILAHAQVERFQHRWVEIGIEIAIHG